MQVRKVPVSHGFAWVRAIVDLGARNPRAVFGAALLFMASMYAPLVIFSLMAGLFAGAYGALAVSVLLVVAMVMLIPVLIGGLMHVIREVEAGRPARAFDLFAPFRMGRAKELATLGLLQIVFGVVATVLVFALGGEHYAEEYAAMMRALVNGTPPVMPQPEHPVLMFVFQLVYNYFTYTIMLLSVPLMLFSCAGLMDSVRASLRASVENVGANVLAGVLIIVGLILAFVAAALLGSLLYFAGGLVHAAVGAALVTAVLIAYISLVLVVLAGGAYLVWRDTFDGPQATTPGVAGIEV